MRALPLGIVIFAMTAASSAFAQSELAGRQQYPQFRVLSGLPGGGFAVLPNGKTGPMGAAALATPIGYTLGTGDYAFGIFNTGHNLNPFTEDEGGHENKSNGSAFGMCGFSYRGYHLTVSGMVLSFHGDSDLNLQFSPPNLGRLGVAAGVQDAFNVAGAGGESIDSLKHDSSRSLYVVGTYALGRGSYVSVGKGERRFQGIFGNVSLPITERLRALTEYDGFNFNAGVLYSLGKVTDIPPNSAKMSCSLFLGAVRGKYGTAGLTLTF